MMAPPTGLPGEVGRRTVMQVNRQRGCAARVDLARILDRALGDDGHHGHSVDVFVHQVGDALTHREKGAADAGRADPVFLRRLKYFCMSGPPVDGQ